MACYNPVRAYQGPINPETGRKTILWQKPKPQFGEEPKTWLIPCGKCIGCRKKQANDWAIRCVHESKMHEQNCFVTLTYAQDKLPQDKSLNRDEFRAFLKAIKRQNPGKRIRYLYCGEYTQKGNPHYHVLLFGHDFADKKLWKTSTRKGNKINYYVSDDCSRAWQNKGFILIGEVNKQTAGYVGKYCFKKVPKQYAAKLPPYANMSRRPGIGASWYEKFKGDIYPSDECRTADGLSLRPPRYYDEKIRKENPEMYEAIKLKREKSGKALTQITVGSKTILVSDNDTVRLAVKEFLAIEKTHKTKDRPMEAQN